MGFPGGSVVKNSFPHAGDVGHLGSIPGSGKKLLKEEMATHSSILALEKCYEQRSLEDYSPQECRD